MNIKHMKFLLALSRIWAHPPAEAMPISVTFTIRELNATCTP